MVTESLENIWIKLNLLESSGYFMNHYIWDKNSTFFPHRVFVWFWEQTVIISLYIINDCFL